MHSQSFIIVDIGMAAWIMKEVESDWSSHRLKKLLFLGVQRMSPLVFAVGGVSINYDGTCEDWIGLARYVPSSQSRLLFPQPSLLQCFV